MLQAHATSFPIPFQCAKQMMRKSAYRKKLKCSMTNCKECMLHCDENYEMYLKLSMCGICRI